MYKIEKISKEEIYARKWWNVITWGGEGFLVAATSLDAVEDALRAMGEHPLTVSLGSPRYAEFLWEGGEDIYEIGEVAN